MRIILVAQLGTSAIMIALFWGINGTIAGYSALLGGLICIVPNAFLALRLVVPRHDPGPGALLRAAYIGEFGKLGLTAVMCAAVFSLVRPLAAGALFCSLVATQLATFSGFWSTDNSQIDGKEQI